MQRVVSVKNAAFYKCKVRLSQIRFHVLFYAGNLDISAEYSKFAHEIRPNESVSINNIIMLYFIIYLSGVCLSMHLVMMEAMKSEKKDAASILFHLLMSVTSWLFVAAVLLKYICSQLLPYLWFAVKQSVRRWMGRK